MEESTERFYHPAMPPTRRFPSPWSIDETAACFIVRDGDKRRVDGMAR